jgi:molybdopterin converting factor small subunit
MARLRLFAAARTAAGTATDTLPGGTVADVLAAAVARYGDAFADVLPSCAVWVDGAPAALDQPVADHAEVAVLPPVSGGGA